MNDQAVGPAPLTGHQLAEQISDTLAEVLGLAVQCRVAARAAASEVFTRPSAAAELLGPLSAARGNLQIALDDIQGALHRGGAAA